MRYLKFECSQDGSGQDLIYLESPQDEIFDPLLSKDLPTSLSCQDPDPPPPVPARQHSKNGGAGRNLANSRSTSAIPG